LGVVALGAQERQGHVDTFDLADPAETLRAALAKAVQRHLPSWVGRLSPHVLRHHCASSLYRNGVDIVAIQELLGHEWIATTMGYIHVHRTHVEDSWSKAADRLAARLSGVRP
jgi:site-specific recombinase XerD